MSNKTKAIILSISVIIAILATSLLIWSSEPMQITFGKEYDFEKDYELYQEYADIYVKTWKVEAFEDELLIKYSGDIPNQTVEITPHINADFITIAVEGSVSKVVAKYPIEVITEEDGSCKINILYENGKYENEKLIDTTLECCYMIFISFTFIIAFFYFTITTVISVINSLIVFIKKKKYKKDIYN